MIQNLKLILKYANIARNFQSLNYIKKKISKDLNQNFLDKRSNFFLLFLINEDYVIKCLRLVSKKNRRFKFFKF